MQCLRCCFYKFKSTQKTQIPTHGPKTSHVSDLWRKIYSDCSNQKTQIEASDRVGGNIFLTLHLLKLIARILANILHIELCCQLCCFISICSYYFFQDVYFSELCFHLKHLCENTKWMQVNILVHIILVSTKRLDLSKKVQNIIELA